MKKLFLSIFLILALSVLGFSQFIKGIDAVEITEKAPRERSLSNRDHPYTRVKDEKPSKITEKAPRERSLSNRDHPYTRVKDEKPSKITEKAPGGKIRATDKQLASDTPFKYLQFAFDGEWMPTADPANIGPKNFKSLQNLRYIDGAVEGVRGYSKTNTTALTTYTKIRSGVQLVTDRTTTSYVLVHAENAALNASQVFYNTTAIPDQGNFVGTALHTDASGAGLGRLDLGPDGHVVYANDVESYIWAGTEMRVAGLYTVDDGVFDGAENPIDHTYAVNNTQQSAGNLVALDVTAGQPAFVILSTRPLKAVKIYVKTANDTNSSLTVKYFNGSWTGVSNGSDGTKPGSISLAQTGTYSFDSTVSDAKPFHYQSKYLYGYYFELSAGTAEIYHVAIDAPWQAMVDIWDGTPRQPIAFQFSFNGIYEDYTLEVNEPSDINTPIAAELDGASTTDSVVIMFDERTAGIRFEMLADMAQTNTAAVTAYYWDGDSWASVGTVTDKTQQPAGDSLGQTGLMSWIPPAITSEYKTTIFGKTGYGYKLVWDATLSGTHGDATQELLVDVVTGVPAQNTVPPYKFFSTYKNRLLGVGYTAGKEGNRVDYTMTAGPDVWNGSESSMQGIQSLYFGSSNAALTAGVQLFNRYGSNLYVIWVGLKETETYLLSGDGPEDFKIFPISKNIGCPAPLTLVSVEVAFEFAKDVERNGVIWLSYAGPYLFDGSVLKPLKGVDNYFDPSNTEAINFDAISNARAWYDPIYKEYNLLIPSGAGQTVNNAWLVYDLIRKRWFQKATGQAEMPQAAWQVQDGNGAKYIYGGIDTGYMMRLENGNSWDGTGIKQVVRTGDMWPTGSVWDLTRIRRVKMLAKRIPEDHTLRILYYEDTNMAEGSDWTWSDWSGWAWTDTTSFVWTSAELSTLSLYLDTGVNRLARVTEPVNLLGWSHGFGFEVTTSDSATGFAPIGWGVEYQIDRKDY